MGQLKEKTNTQLHKRIFKTNVSSQSLDKSLQNILTLSEEGQYELSKKKMKELSLEGKKAATQLISEHYFKIAQLYYEIDNINETFNYLEKSRNLSPVFEVLIFELELCLEHKMLERARELIKIAQQFKPFCNEIMTLKTEYNLLKNKKDVSSFDKKQISILQENNYSLKILKDVIS